MTAHIWKSEVWNLTWIFILWLSVLSNIPLLHGQEVTPTEDERSELEFYITWTEQLLQRKDYKFCLGTDVFGIITMTNIFWQFTQAYHYSFPAVRFWSEARRLQADQNRAIWIRAQELLKDNSVIQYYSKELNCSLHYNNLKFLEELDFGDIKEANDARDSLKSCILYHKYFPTEVDPAVFMERVYISCYETIELVLDALYYASHPLEYNSFRNRFNRSHFDNVLFETTAFNLEIHDRLYNGGFQNYIDKVRNEGRTDEADELEERLKEFKNRLENPAYPYHKMYFKGDQVASTKFWTEGEYTNFRETTSFIVYHPFPDGIPYKSKNGTKRWSKNDGFIRFKSDVNTQAYLDKFRSVIVSLLYVNPFYVKMLPKEKRDPLQTDKDGNEVVIGDGMWEWDLSKPIHNMRLAWELMGGLLEEIKCYMKETYYFDLREQALQATQLNLSEGALFSGISYTMYSPCRIESETDLVSPYCTAKNHEICAPVSPLESSQRTGTDSDLVAYGGKALLKPKWIYRYKDEAKMCWGRKDYVMQHYHCRCGFRLDCGKDLGVNITCQLTPNDLLRGQCRGSVGYPCKTLPLAPGRFHESCVTGYCNLEENSCEDRPQILEKSGGHSLWTAKSMNGFLLFVCLAALVISGIGQWMMQSVQVKVFEHSSESSLHTNVDKSGRRFFHNRWRNCLLLVTASLVLTLQFGFTTGLSDDWYGFVSFKNANEFESAYRHTCSYTYDLFREPREVEMREKLRARKELLTPIRFSSKQTQNSTEQFSLHIYNYPSIRKGYSVSYGFQRNKECLHGQDSDCVVVPELERVRALVVNAERFGSETRNLNFLKDHFLIEYPERFVSILNGGSPNERKFYEAVFLGGYSDDPRRTSHQIDGKKYPLEIYMYFLDETVPSASLATILVVLVQESSRDNPHIKPIVNAVENKLYNAERRFLDTNKALIRRERLFHHLKGSTSYEVYRKMKTNRRDEPVIHHSMESSVESESIFTKVMEAFEKMQALEAEVFFLLEDQKQLELSATEVKRIFDDYESHKTVNEMVPNRLIEFRMLIEVAVFKGVGLLYSHCLSIYVSDDERDGCAIYNLQPCERYLAAKILLFEYLNADRQPELSLEVRSTHPRRTHLKEFYDLAVTVCKHFEENYRNLTDRNLYNVAGMKELDTVEKYQMIQDFMKERIDRKEINKLLYNHFHGNNSDKMTSRWHRWKNPTISEVYKDEDQMRYLADAMLDFTLLIQKFYRYQAIKSGQMLLIEEIAENMGYADIDAMETAIRNLKHGNNLKELKYPRVELREKFEDRELPLQEKKRNLVELGGMEILEEDIKKHEALDPIKVFIEESFQISWLIPQDGGYYYYDGSSPLPPCFRAQNVIVFKRPITMSKQQITVLTRIPTSFNRSNDILVTTPFVHDTRFEVELSAIDTEKSRIEEVIVPVYNHRKNHLFLGHDGIRKNSVEEWERILEEKKKNDAIQVKPKMGLIITMICCVINAITLLV